MQSQYHALHYSASSSKKELNTDYSSSYFNNLQHYNIYLTHHRKVNIVCRQLIDYAEAKKAHCPVVNNIIMPIWLDIIYMTNLLCNIQSFPTATVEAIAVSQQDRYEVNVETVRQILRL